DKGLNREALAQFKCGSPVVIPYVFEHRVVICRIDHHRDRFIVLCRAANHRRTADVDILNRFGEGDVWFGNGRFEWIKVNHHQIDRLEATFAGFGLVFLVTTFVEKTAMHAGMQSLYTSSQDFRRDGGLAEEGENSRTRDLEL